MMDVLRVHARTSVVSVSALVLVGGILATPAGAQGTAAGDNGAVVTKYCVTCHSERLKTAGLMLDKANIADPPATADIWEKAIRKMRVGMMPPQSAPHPDAETQAALISYLVTSLDRS